MPACSYKPNTFLLQDKKTKQGASNSSNGDKLKGANTKKLMDQLPFSPTDGATSGVDTGNGGTSPSKQKLESIRGCDWLQEISVTVRKNTKTNIPRDRWAGDTVDFTDPVSVYSHRSSSFWLVLPSI